MNYTHNCHKYDAGECQVKAVRKQALSNRHQENRGNQTRRRR